MNKYFFESSMSVSFTAQAGGETVALNSLVSARLYSERPTLAQKVDDAGTGAIEKVESWTNGNSTNEKLIAFSGVDDPEPNSNSDFKIYYLAVGFKLEADETTIYKVLPIYIWRIKPIGSRYGVSATDVIGRQSKLSSYNDGSYLESMINDAEEEIETDLAIEGYQVEDVDLSDLHLLVLLKAIELAARDKTNDPNDTWADKAKFYAGRYGKRLKTIRIKHDQDGDGLPEENEATAIRTSVSTFR